MSDVLLEIRDLSVNYGHIEAIRDITFEVPQGSIVTLIGANGAGKSTTLKTISGLRKVRAGSIVPLLGANGAGKSTTLKTISGLRKVRAGSIVYDGQDLAKVSPDKRVQIGISQAPEGRGIFPGMTVRENLEMGAYVRRDRSA